MCICLLLVSRLPECQLFKLRSWLACILLYQVSMVGCKTRSEVSETRTPENSTHIALAFNASGELAGKILLHLDRVQTKSTEQVALPQCHEILADDVLVGEIICDGNNTSTPVRAGQTTQVCRVGGEQQKAAGEKVIKKICTNAQLRSAAGAETFLLEFIPD